MSTDAIGNLRYASSSYSNVVDKSDGTTYYTGINPPEISTGEKDSEKDMFLKLMIEQMRQQDPLNPMDATDMMVQLAQLNTVQQLIDLNTSFENFMGNQDLVQANNLMGRWVEGLDANMSLINGKVDWVEVVDGVVTLHLGDKLLLLNQVISVREEAPATDDETVSDDTPDSGDTSDDTGMAV
jgi:flagellar basal-body rod modification protein FlgD